MAAALRARRRRPDLDITIIEKSSYIASANCSIPAYLDGRLAAVDSLQQLSPQTASSEHRLNVLIKHQALEINQRNHLVRVENLETGQTFDLPFHRLILSTGADPIRPNWQNVNAKGIFTLRNLEHAKNLRDYLERRKPRNFVVIGTGTIAQVCASALRSYGMQVMMIGQCEGLMEDLEPPISNRIRQALSEGGINDYFIDNYIAFKVSLDNEVEAVSTISKAFPCQGVLIALGVKPNVHLSETSGLTLGYSGAIRIDRHLMTSRFGIFSCGDCAETTNRIIHRPTYWPLATTAARQGRQAGESASGGQGFDPGTLQARIWTCFKLRIARIGLSPGQAKESGIKFMVTPIRARTRSRFYGGDELDLVVISDQKDGRIIGAQMAGYDGVLSKLNAFSAAITGKLTLKELENLDMGYSPELSSLWDPMQIAGRLGRRT